MWPLTPITSRRLHQCRPLKNVNSLVHSIFHSIFHSPFQSIFQSSYSTSTIILPDQSLSASVSPEQHKHLAQMSKITRCTWVLFHHFGINMSAMESNLSTSLSWTLIMDVRENQAAEKRFKESPWNTVATAARPISRLEEHYKVCWRWRWLRNISHA